MEGNTFENIRDYYHSDCRKTRNPRVTTKVKKELLLAETIIVKGIVYEYKFKSLGAGVHEVYLEKY
jgi:hypothetical protein